MKSTLVRLGIRGFNPKLRLAADPMKDLRTPEGAPIPPNTLAELRREMARLRFVNDQIKEIEVAREERLAAAPDNKHHSMVRLLSQIHGLGLETADMLVGEVFSRDIPHRRALARYARISHRRIVWSLIIYCKQTVIEIFGKRQKYRVFFRSGPFFVRWREGLHGFGEPSQGAPRRRPVFPVLQHIDDRLVG